jgi:hypothetical protein
MFDKIAGRKPPGTVSKKFRLNIFWYLQYSMLLLPLFPHQEQQQLQPL